MEELGRRKVFRDTFDAMSGAVNFFHLRSKTMRPCFETKLAHAEAMRNTLCPGCAHPKPDVIAIDVRLQARSPRDGPLNFVFGSCVGLIHIELLGLLGNDIVRRDLYLGRVFGDDGEVVTDWATFRGRREVIIRGSQDAEYRTCSACGRNLYHATGRRYLYPAPSDDATIFESDLAGLVIPSAVYERVATKKWRMLGIDELPVLEKPTDGLGSIPSARSI